MPNAILIIRLIWLLIRQESRIDWHTEVPPEEQVKGIQNR